MHVEDELWIEQRTDAPLPADAVPVWISEAAADLYGLQPGSALALPLNGRKVMTSVRGLWRDYEHQNGAVLMQRELYQKLTGDTAVNGVGIWTQDATPVAEVIAAIQRLIPATSAFDLRVPQELRKLSLEVFDRTFAVTYLLEAVAVVIGLLGISASTSAQVLARRGEFGVLRYIGLTRKQIAATLGIEGLLLGSVGVLIGLVTGVVVSMILIYVVNRQSFHWSMDVFIPWTALALLSALLAGMSALIAVISGRRAMSGDVVAAVKEDW
jgi:putative ABC transport system permease protein